MRILGNIFRSTLYLAMGALVGYYSLDTGGIISLLTNVFFFALGILMVASWRKKPSEPFEQPFGELSLNEQDIDVSVAESPDMTDKMEQPLS